jgi:glycyl-tRNA synthetase alpha subunit
MLGKIWRVAASRKKRDKRFERPPYKLTHHFRAKVITPPYNLHSNYFGDSNIQPLPKVKYNVCNFDILCYVT